MPPTASTRRLPRPTPARVATFARTPSRTHPAASARRVASASATVSFEIHAQLEYGDGLCVTGNVPALGDWDASRGLVLRWTEGNVWVGRVDVESSVDLQFKCVRMREDARAWEDGDNRAAVVGRGATLVKCRYGERGCEVSQQDEGENVGASESLHAGVSDEESNGDDCLSDAAPRTQPTATRSVAWDGDDVRLMQANEHSSERPSDMTWDVSRLDEGTAARAVVLGDKEGGSWFQKLAVVANEIGIGREITRDKLAACATYLQWISTGTIKCVESGGHRRPNGPAMVGRGIFISMEQIQGAMYRHGTDLGEVERAVMRRIHPWLPSFNEEFTNAVPLTRIRDIAHRNDIPQDLKRTIKHTIQNKLHRNAGPEDLIATEVVLERITATPGEFSEDFVREFHEFYIELKRFFNASGVFERLDSLRGTLDAETEPLIDDLIATQRKIDADADGWFGTEGDDLRHALEVSTELRAYFCAGLSTGMRNDAPDDSVRQRQAWRQVEIALEEYAFVVVARCNNLIERAEETNARDNRAWKHAGCIASLALRQIGLSGWRTLETGIIARELTRWTESGVADEDAALRLKASLRRASRLVDSHTHALMTGFGDAPMALADAFGLQKHVGSTFIEAVIRAGVPFQLSRCVESLNRAADEYVAGDGFDPIVLGLARGTLVELDRLSPEAASAHAGGDIIAVVRAFDGDEEISTAGPHVKAAILYGELAHLSHLAIRARQERAPLVSALSADARRGLEAFIGRECVLSVTASGTEVRAYDSSSDAVAESTAESIAQRDAGAVVPVSCDNVDEMTWLALEDATMRNAGAKSAVCSALVALARESKSGFSAPRGFVVPFGSMEASVRGDARWEQLLADVERATLENIDDACAAIQSCVIEHLPSKSVVQDACSSVTPGTRLVVRSSANVEDLTGMSAAGLYESIVGVDAADIDAVQRAIADVWASLYSRRAVLARRTAGVKQSDARMAVFAQELSPNALSFVLHSQSPVRGSESVQAELCVGLGETLASGVDGTPWRLEIDRDTGEVSTMAYANHSTATRCRYSAPTYGRVTTESIDYTRQELSVDDAKRDEIGKKLARVAVELETAFGSAQDIEGGLCGDEIVVVQARPQT
jgi:phosphoglucan,water dikinase